MAKAKPIDRWETFLERIRRIPDRGSALAAAGISYSEFSKRIATDEKFAEEYEKAWDVGIDSVEDEVVRRAVLGVDEPIYQGGLLVGHKTRYSDALLMYWLSAHRKKYRSPEDTQRSVSEEAKATLREIFSGANTAPEEKPAGRKRRG